MAVTWEDLLEASPEDPAAWAVTRRQVRETRMEREEAKERDLAEKKEDLRKEEKMGQKGEENRRKARGTVELRPGQLVVSIAREAVQQYIEGYLQDPVFKGPWKASLSTADELVTTHRYYKDEDSLLFFRDADWKACLCVPCALVLETLKEHHESAWETTHTGAACLYHRLAY